MEAMRRGTESERKIGSLRRAYAAILASSEDEGKVHELGGIAESVELNG